MVKTKFQVISRYRDNQLQQKGVSKRSDGRKEKERILSAHAASLASTTMLDTQQSKCVVMERKMNKGMYVLNERREAKVFFPRSVTRGEEACPDGMVVSIIRAINDKVIRCTVTRFKETDVRKTESDLEVADQERFVADWAALWEPKLPLEKELTPTMLAVCFLEPFPIRFELPMDQVVYAFVEDSISDSLEASAAGSQTDDEDTLKNNDSLIRNSKQSVTSIKEQRDNTVYVNSKTLERYGLARGENSTKRLSTIKTLSPNSIPSANETWSASSEDRIIKVNRDTMRSFLDFNPSSCSSSVAVDTLQHLAYEDSEVDSRTFFCASHESADDVSVIYSGQAAPEWDSSNNDSTVADICSTKSERFPISSKQRRQQQEEEEDSGVYATQHSTTWSKFQRRRRQSPSLGLLLNANAIDEKKVVERVRPRYIDEETFLSSLRRFRDQLSHESAMTAKALQDVGSTLKELTVGFEEFRTQTASDVAHLNEELRNAQAVAATAESSAAKASKYISQQALTRLHLEQLLQPIKEELAGMNARRNVLEQQTSTCEDYVTRDTLIGELDELQRQMALKVQHSCNETSKNVSKLSKQVAEDVGELSERLATFVVNLSPNTTEPKASPSRRIGNNDATDGLSRKRYKRVEQLRRRTVDKQVMEPKDNLSSTDIPVDNGRSSGPRMDAAVVDGYRRRRHKSLGGSPIRLRRSKHCSLGRDRDTPSSHFMR